MTSLLSHLECTSCSRRLAAASLHSLCACGGVLFARYDLSRLAGPLSRAEVLGRKPGMWRVPELMPLVDLRNIVSLGEGATPLLAPVRLRRELEMPHLYLKDEGLNPTGSFKARGLGAAVSKALELGVTAGVIPSAGNAGLAFAAYAAAAGIRARVIVPRATPEAFKKETRLLGADLVEVEGSIADAGKLAREGSRDEGVFNFATFAEPYRVEGKKTMGYELAYDLGFELPEVIVYPTGGGTGLVGMAKAFDEMEALGWVDARRPRLVSVQAEGCAPVVKAYTEGSERTAPWPAPATLAAGLRVPSPLAGTLILRDIRASRGTAVAVSDQALLEATRRLARLEGIVASPEAGAALAGVEVAARRGEVGRDERIVVFLTGSGARYLDVL